MMKQIFTPTYTADTLFRLRSQPRVFPKWEWIHYSYTTCLFVGFILLFTGSLSGQQLQQLDSYLEKMEEEVPLGKSNQSFSQASVPTESIKSEIFDLLSTVYLQDGKMSFHQTGRLLRVVTTAKDLPGMSGMAENMGDELMSVRSLIIKVSDEKTMQSIREGDLNIYKMLPSLERVFFILEYETNSKARKQLESKLPQPPKRQMENQPNAPVRSPVVFLYKTSIPA